jgi:hypothetical protein
VGLSCKGGLASAAAWTVRLAGGEQGVAVTRGLAGVAGDRGGVALRLHG